MIVEVVLKAEEICLVCRHQPVAHMDSHLVAQVQRQAFVELAKKTGSLFSSCRHEIDLRKGTPRK
jgi:hypothetical protein